MNSFTGKSMPTLFVTNSQQAFAIFSTDKILPYSQGNEVCL